MKALTILMLALALPGCFDAPQNNASTRSGTSGDLGTSKAAGADKVANSTAIEENSTVITEESAAVVEQSEGHSGEVDSNAGGAKEGGATSAIMPTDNRVVVGEGKEFSLALTDETGNNLTAAGVVSWRVSDGSIAILEAYDNKARITAKAAGKFALIATYDGVETVRNLEAQATALESIEIQLENVTNGRILINQNLTVRVLGIYNTNDKRDLTAEADITASGSVLTATETANIWQASSTGTGSIRAAIGDVANTANFEVVEAALTGISLTPATRLMAIGDNITMTVTGQYEDGSSRDVSDKAQFVIGNTAIIGTVANQPRTFSALGRGDTQIIANVDGYEDSAEITVNEEIDDLSIVVARNSLPAGETTTVQVVASFASGDTQDISGTADFSANASSLQFSKDAQGKPTIKGLVPGSYVFKVTSGSFQKSATINITDAVLVGIAVSLNPSQAVVGATAQASARGTFSDSSTSDITQSVVWRSAQTGVATIQNTSGSEGLIATVANGQTQISASLNNLSDARTFTVSAQQPAPGTVDLKINNQDQTVYVGVDEVFQITVATANVSNCRLSIGGAQQVFATSLSRSLKATAYVEARCVDGSGSDVTDTIKVAVIPNTSITMAFAGDNQTSQTVPNNTTGALTWSVANATSCTLRQINHAGTSTYSASSSSGSRNLKITAASGQTSGGSIRLDCNNNTSSDSKTITFTTTRPTASLTVGGSTGTKNVTQGTSLVVVVTSQNSSSCSVAYAGSSKTYSGSYSLTASASGPVVATCRDAANNEASATVQINATPYVPPAPTLTGVRIVSDGATSLPELSSAIVRGWADYDDGSSQNITNQGQWQVSNRTLATITGIKADQATLSTFAAGNFNVSFTFGGKTATKAFTATALAAPTVSLTVEGQSQNIAVPRSSNINIAWTSANATSCTLKANSSTINYNLSGNAIFTLPDTMTISLTCQNAKGANATKSILVSVTVPSLKVTLNGSEASSQSLVYNQVVMFYYLPTNVPVSGCVAKYNNSLTIPTKAVTGGTYNVTCTDNAGNKVSKSIAVNILMPKVALTINNSSQDVQVASGTTVTLGATYQNTSSCTLKKNGSNMALSASQSVTITSTTVFGLSCSTLGGQTVTASITATVPTSTPSQPLLRLLLNGSYDDATISSGSNVSLSWMATNVDSCTLYKGSTAVGSGLVGSVTVNNITSTSYFFLYCLSTIHGNQTETITANVGN